MIVKEDVSHGKHSEGGQALDIGVPASAGVDGKAGKHRTGLTDDETCSDEDNDDDDIARQR